ncbi:hypothetical protein FRD01_17795 [Microvenator marinus]|uniref:Uncharacterized protein n=1 Tax=Microvenator marinus TaxID=2600177 RepID=A0A5B8XV63_9DELT|nr:hypothetical protein FRD01_17795 [Microvenator marinus]
MLAGWPSASAGASVPSAGAASAPSSGAPSASASEPSAAGAASSCATSCCAVSAFSSAFCAHAVEAALSKIAVKRTRFNLVIMTSIDRAYAVPRWSIRDFPCSVKRARSIWITKNTPEF